LVDFVVYTTGRRSSLHLKVGIVASNSHAISGLFGDYTEMQATAAKSTRKGLGQHKFGGSLPRRPEVAASERVGICRYSLAGGVGYYCRSYHRKRTGQRQSSRKVLDSTTDPFVILARQFAASERVGGSCRYRLNALVAVSVCW
jgi:hypothetical protein